MADSGVLVEGLDCGTRLAPGLLVPIGTLLGPGFIFALGVMAATLARGILSKSSGMTDTITGEEL